LLKFGFQLIIKKNKMKKTFHFLGLLTLMISLSLTSCGPSKKLVLSEARVDKLQKDNADKQSQLDNTQSQLNDCNSKVKNLNQSIQQTECPAIAPGRLRTKEPRLS